MQSRVREKRSEKSSSAPKPSYRPGEKVKAPKRLQLSVRKVRRVDGLGEDKEHTSDGKEEEVEEQQTPQEQEVGEHSGPETPAQVLQGRVPQLEGTEDGQMPATPALSGRKHTCDTCEQKDSQMFMAYPENIDAHTAAGDAPADEGSVGDVPERQLPGRGWIRGCETILYTASQGFSATCTVFPSSLPS